MTYVTDQSGMIVDRDETDGLSGGDPRQLNYYYAGFQLGQVGNNGTDNLEYGAFIKDRLAPPATSGGAFRNGATTPTPFADFEQSYGAINGTGTNANQSYTASGGETLGFVAQQLWGDASLWYLIASANGLTGTENLAAGQVLTIPSKVYNSRNAADTWRPYDPNDALGNVSPTTLKPQPSKKNNCGVFGQIIIAAMSIAISMVLPIGGAIGGALSNLAAQGIGVAVGIQDKINWTGVATAGLTAGISSALQFSGAFNAIGVGGANFGAQAAQGAITSLVAQGVSVATGLQRKFDWAGVAAAGLGNAAGSQAGGAVRNSRFGATFASATADGLASAASRSLITGTSFGDNIVAVLPGVIGRTIGSLMERAIAGGRDTSGAPGGNTGRSGKQSLIGASPAQVAAISNVSDELSRMGAWANEALGDDVEDIVITSSRRPGDVTDAEIAAAAGEAVVADFQEASARLTTMRTPLPVAPATIVSHTMSRFSLILREVEFASYKAGLGAGASTFDWTSHEAAFRENWRLIDERGALATDATNQLAVELGKGLYTAATVFIPAVGAFEAARQGDFTSMSGFLHTVVKSRIPVARVLPPPKGADFVGPLIGKSGFRTSDEFAQAVGTRYQGFVDDAYRAAQRLEAKGLLRGNPNTRVGNHVDRISANRLRAYLQSEGISEGPGSLVQINRWLRDPSGAGSYVRPDVRIPAAGRIYDATVGYKAYDSTQVVRFGQYSGGDRITVVRPSSLGSYSFVP